MIPLAQAVSETYDIITPLSFGSFAVSSNDSVYELTVSETGVVNNDSAFIVGAVAPVRGEMVLEDLLPDTEIHVEFDDGVLVPDNGPGASFTITDFTITSNRAPPNEFRTTAGGDLTLYYGASLRTSGNGQVYVSGPYQGDFEITIDY